MNIEQEIIKLLKDNNITLEEIVERIKQDNKKNICKHYISTAIYRQNKI